MKAAVFIPNPHVRMDCHQGAPYTPIESLSVMAMAEHEGLATQLFDVNHLIETGRLQVEPDIWTKAAALAAELDPALLVMETWADTFHHTVLLLRALRRTLPDVPAIFLGAGTSALAVETLAAIPEVDGVIRGEAEPAMAVLARTVLSRRLPPAPGLVRRTEWGVQDAELTAVEDLDALPRPAFHRSFLRPGDSVPVEAGRGCDVGCTFCALAGQWSPRYRPRRPERLAEEMLDLGRRYPGSVIDLCQDARFFADSARVHQLCACLAAHPNRPRFTCHARIDALDASALSALAGAGCCGILFGIESGCPDMQARIGKRLDLSRIAGTIAAASRLKITTRATFIVGFNGETEASMARTAHALFEARRAGAQTAVQVLRAQPGTPSFDQDSARLVFEPLLATVSPDDREAQDVVAALPRLHAASYRLADTLSRDRVLGAWLGLTIFVEPLAALLRHGADPERLMGALTVGEAQTLDDAATKIAEQIRAFAKRTCFVDLVALADTLDYWKAIAKVGRGVEGPRAHFDSTVCKGLLASPDVCPWVTAPVEHVALWTPLTRVLAGDFAPCPHPGPVHLVVAKVSAAPADASFFTRQSAIVKTFTVGKIAPLVLSLCDGHHSLHAIAESVAAQTGHVMAISLRACRDVLLAFATAGVLDLASGEREVQLVGPL